MNKKIIGVSIITIIIIFSTYYSTNSEEKENDIIFHVTLANPELYNNGIYTDKFTIDIGTYFFRFVPNGSSPEILSIKLNGQNYNFSENFKLKGIPHESETSKYFTWKYEGQKNITNNSLKEISIIINPNGNVMGSVSVDIIKKKEA
ncbi:MAG: hypothetical protein HOE93_04385 [Nitrosopumilus sp.]|nr:hypothetical protein [Nitrosopumilus sp.]MBT3573605.1 hypothetical protein [Nitrosopumilus sp.]MBT3861753.1 hypothetical protein [Nitrosopumilus sp.]MBT3956533.1 hypothetical protein [Nitrosopumilus sp.]MBT4299423.1 hypothetical protein [Nitrosopumilus sp.]